MHTLLRLEDDHRTRGRFTKAIIWNGDGTYKDTLDDRPTLGASVLVGFGLTNHWLTTEVQEIIEDTPEYVKFKTKNSTYEWRILPDPEGRD